MNNSYLKNTLKILTTSAVLTSCVAGQQMTDGDGIYSNAPKQDKHHSSYIPPNTSTQNTQTDTSKPVTVAELEKAFKEQGAKVDSLESELREMKSENTNSNNNNDRLLYVLPGQHIYGHYMGPYGYGFSGGYMGYGSAWIFINGQGNGRHNNHSMFNNNNSNYNSNRNNGNNIRQNNRSLNHRR